MVAVCSTSHKSSIRKVYSVVTDGLTITVFVVDNIVEGSFVAYHSYHWAAAFAIISFDSQIQIFRSLPRDNSD